MSDGLSVSPTIEDHLQKFRNWLSLAPRSKDNYTARVRSFYHHTGRDTPLNPAELTDLDAELLTDDLVTHISCETDKYALKKYFDWLQQRSPSVDIERTTLFFKNKIDKAEVNPQKRNISEKILSLAKVQKLTTKTPDRLRSDQHQTRLLLQLMYDTATRISGMLWLEWRDIWRDEWEGQSLEDHELVIHHERSKSKESGVVELSDGTLHRLQIHEERVTPTDPNQKVFFPEMTEQSAYQKIYRNFKTQAEKSGVPEASPHWFRHSRLTHLGLQMLDEGKSYPEIKERLRRYGRHRSGETTEIYIEILKNRKAERISKYSTIEWRGRSESV